MLYQITEDLLLLLQRRVLEPVEDLVGGKAELCGVEQCHELEDCSPFKQPLDPIIHPIGRQTHLFRDLRRRLARIPVELVQDLPVLEVEFYWHIITKYCFLYLNLAVLPKNIKESFL